jgi:hypothetical protein
VTVPLSYALGILDLAVMHAFFAAAILYGVFISVLAVLLDDLAFRRYRGTGQLLSLASAALVEAVALRPLCSYWRVAAFQHHFRRDLSWGRMERAGIAAAAAKPTGDAPARGA